MVESDKLTPPKGACCSEGVMSALSPQQARAMRHTVRSGDSAPTPAPNLASRWADLHDRAAQLAALAQLSPEPFTGPLATFPGRIGKAAPWQRALADEGLEDIEAMMRPGLAALETLKNRGAAANAPALALWREFYTARGAVLALAKE